MERRIDDPAHTPEPGSRRVHRPETDDHRDIDRDVDDIDAVEDDDELRVITQEGDVAVIRDLQPERAPTSPPPTSAADGVAVAPASDVAPALDLSDDSLALRAPDGATQTRYRTLIAGHIASDIFCLNVVLWATGLLEEIIASRALDAVGWFVAVGSTLAWVGIFQAFGLYASIHLSSSEEVRRVVGATSVGAAVLMIFAGGLPTGNEATLGFAFVTLVVLELATRVLWRRYARTLRAKGLLAYRTVIVGSARDAASVARSLIDDERSGFFPVGRIATDPGGDEPGSPPFLGSIADAARLVDERSIEAIVVASPTLTSAELGQLQQLSRREGLALRLVARVPHMLTNRLTLQRVGPLMTVAVKPAELTGTQAALKRAFDISLATIGLVLSLPFQLVIGLLVKLTSPGPVLFRQLRVTRNNELFTVYKFRTMDRDADRIMDAHAIDRTQPFFKGGDEPPVTPVGRVLRMLSLDELPQLWNVVKGDMSLVGPRPLTAEQVKANPELLGPRHDVRAGLTGWWQVNGRSDVSASEAIQQDLFYIENWSLLLDLYIMGRTVGVVLTRKGAR